MEITNLVPRLPPPTGNECAKIGREPGDEVRRSRLCGARSGSPQLFDSAAHMCNCATRDNDYHLGAKALAYTARGLARSWNLLHAHAQLCYRSGAGDSRSAWCGCYRSGAGGSRSGAGDARSGAGDSCSGSSAAAVVRVMWVTPQCFGCSAAVVRVTPAAVRVTPAAVQVLPQCDASDVGDCRSGAGDSRSDAGAATVVRRTEP